GDLALLDRVVDPGERERELVVREADVGEVRVRAGEMLAVDLKVEFPLLVVHPGPTILEAWIAPTSVALRSRSARSSSSSRAARQALPRCSTSLGTRRSTAPRSPRR